MANNNQNFNAGQNIRDALQKAQKAANASGKPATAFVNITPKKPVVNAKINQEENAVSNKIANTKMNNQSPNLGKNNNKNNKNDKQDEENKRNTEINQKEKTKDELENSKQQKYSGKMVGRGVVPSIGLGLGSEQTSSSSVDVVSTVQKIKKYKWPIMIGGGIVALLFTVIIVFSMFLAVQNNIIDAATEWLENGKNQVASFFDKFDNFLKGNGWSDDETAFLNELNQKNEYYENRNLQINVPLIMSTLMTKQLYNSKNPSDDMGEEFASIDEAQTDINEIRYGSMIGDMRKLVEYQVVKFFSLPSNADPSVYETLINPPLAVLNGAANLLNVAADTLFPRNMRLSNANYLSNLRFGKSASEDVINSESPNLSSTSSSYTGQIRLTNFIDYSVGWRGMSPYGYMKERFRLNEKGWWMYNDPDTGMEYLAVAAPTTYCLGTGCGQSWSEIDGITYYEYGDIIPLNIAGENYQAMVIDSCGACMSATNPLKIDVYASRDYFSESGLTSAGQAAGAVMPDELTTTIGSFQSKPTQDFWVYKDPTQEEKQDINGYKNGYIYKAYSDAFVGLDDSAIPEKVESIIKTIYDMKDSYMEYSNMGNNTTNTLDTITGERTSRPSRTNAFYYDQTTDSGADGTLEGECAWYATGRAKEFLASINSTETWTDNPDGGDFCNTADAQKFNTGTTPKAGSLISWSYEPYGHVAFVESVNADGTFNITEAGISFGQWSKGARSIINSGDENKLRKENCEGNGTGCINIQKNITTSSYSGFKCFIYLTEPKNGGNTSE